MDAPTGWEAQLLRERAFVQGRRAFDRGLPRSANPHRTPLRTVSADERAAAWEWGWLTAEAAKTNNVNLRMETTP